MKKSKSTLIAASLIFLLTGAVGCSSTNTSATSASKEPAAATATAIQTAQPSDDALGKIKQNKVLTAGSEPDFRPFLYVDNGQNIGYSHDLLEYVAKDIGVQYKEVLLPWDGILVALDTKKFDMVHDAVMITPQRLEKYLYTSPIADASVAIMVRKDNTDIKTPEDLVGKTVGSQRGSGMLDTLKQYNETSLKAKGGVKKITEYVGFPEAYQDLKNKRIDAVANSMPNLQTIVKQFPDDYKIIDSIGEKSYFAWAFRKDDNTLRDAVQKSIENAAKDGTLAKLQTKWFGAAYDLPTKVPN
jgi:polar amino acid transport system substrate-binding protein